MADILEYVTGLDIGAITDEVFMVREFCCCWFWTELSVNESHRFLERLCRIVPRRSDASAKMQYLETGLLAQ